MRFESVVGGKKYCSKFYAKTKMLIGHVTRTTLEQCVKGRRLAQLIH